MDSLLGDEDYYVSNTPMRFRMLRITWTVFCGIACVLLIALWVRSYWWIDGIVFYQKCPIEVACSTCGSIRLGRIDDESTSCPKMGWDTYTYQIDWDTESEDIPSFVWLVDGPQRVLAIPLWFFATTFGIAAGLPWFHWSKRFTTRTLLLAMTLVAVVLGLIVWLVR